MDAHQHALAAEIRAEAAAQRITAKELQKRTHVSSSAWSNYFVACTRDVPIGVIMDVARELGMATSELLRRAEAREEQEREGGSGINVAKILAESPHLEAVREQGRRALGGDARAGD